MLHCELFNKAFCEAELEHARKLFKREFYGKAYGSFKCNLVMRDVFWMYTMGGSYDNYQKQRAESPS